MEQHDKLNKKEAFWEERNYLEDLRDSPLR